MGRGGQVIPTLNAFDVGDGREVVLILYPEEVIGTITTAFGAKNYSNDQELREGSVIVYMEEPMLMQEREGKEGGGKGVLISDRAFSLRTSNFHTLFDNKLTVRRLTPIECERLQGFPDNWTDGQADSSRYKQMGNAVAVPVVNWIIERMVK